MSTIMDGTDRKHTKYRGSFIKLIDQFMYLHVCELRSEYSNMCILQKGTILQVCNNSQTLGKIAFS